MIARKSAETAKPTRIFNRYFYFVAALLFLSSMSYNFMSATMSLHIEGINLPAFYTGVLMTIFSTSAAIFRLAGGRVVDRRGRRASIVVGFFFYALGVIGMGFARAEWLLLLACFINGSGFALAGTGMSVASADVVPVQRLGEGIGYLSLAQPLSGLVGPFLGLIIFANYGFSATMSAAGLLLFLAVALGCLYRYEHIAENQAKREPEKAASINVSIDRSASAKKLPSIWTLIDSKAIPSSLVYLFVCLSNSCIITFITLFAQNNEIPNAGLFFTFSALSVVVSRITLGKLSDRRGTLSAVIPGIMLSIISCVMLIASPRYSPLYYIAGALYGFATGITIPALNAAAILKTSIERRGAATTM